jgi:hypothetical protein
MTARALLYAAELACFVGIICIGALAWSLTS